MLVAVRWLTESDRCACFAPSAGCVAAHRGLEGAQRPGEAGEGSAGERARGAMSEKIDELQELFMSKRGQQIQYTIGRIMLTFTFLDDALRVFKEWGSQVDYMGGQLGPLKPIASALLLVFIIAQVGGSVSLLLNKYANIGAWALLGVVAGQVVLYTNLFDIHFFLRNAAVIGGLFVLVTSDDPYKAKRMLSGLMDTSACVPAYSTPSPADDCRRGLHCRSLICF